MHFKRLIDAYPELPLTSEQLLKVLYPRTRKPLSDEWRHGFYRTLKVLYRFLEKKHRLPVNQWGVVNPINDVKVPTPTKKLPASLDASEVQLAIDACQTEKEQACIALLADCGIRVGELVNLKREDIGENAEGKGIILVTGKTGERSVPISPQVKDSLLLLEPSGPLFLNMSGRPYTVSGIYQQIVRPILERAGIKKRHMGPHLFRHTAARQMLVGGADLVSVQKVLGHSNIETTRRYSELSDAEVHDVHDKATLINRIHLNFKHDKKETESEPVNKDQLQMNFEKGEKDVEPAHQQ